MTSGRLADLEGKLKRYKCRGRGIVMEKIADPAGTPLPSRETKMHLLHRAVLGVVFVGIVAGGVAYLIGNSSATDFIWATTILVALIPLSFTIVHDIARKRVAVDFIALLAMAGSLILGEYLAGAVIALMLSGGTTLENYAAARAKRDLTALLERAPKVAHRYENGTLASLNVSEVRPGDRLLVKPGEVVPVDGTVTGLAVLDESTLTGESRPVEKGDGDSARSGTVNAGSPFDLIASATAEESTYAAIIDLVRKAQASRGPFARTADRFAVIFLPITLVAAGAAWIFSGDPVRALAVVVVATPCPLILAAPVALVSGISRAARRGAVIKGGGALEALAQSEILLMDKTGTLTEGTPIVSMVEGFEFDSSELLRLAASLDQVSHHPYGAAIVKAARDRGLALSLPTQVQEELGTGIEGVVDGRQVRVGRADWAFKEELAAPLKHIRRRATLEGKANVFVNVLGAAGGVLILDDPLRSDAPRTIRLLRGAGIRRVVLVTGDHPDVADPVGNAVGVDQVLAERSPQEKVDAVMAEKANGKTVMVGDGINDAPALAAADVGVALGARGSAAHSEAADVVLTVDRLDRLSEAISIAQRSRRIALQSVIAGMALSTVGMVFAGAGLLVPVAGAMVQEAIDVAVILNALRALGGGRRKQVVSEPEIGERFRLQHRLLLPEVERLRLVADRIDGLAPEASLLELRSIGEFLAEELLPHEAEEESLFYPAVARLVGGSDPTATMIRAHREIRHLGRLYLELLKDLPAGGPRPSDIGDIRRILYGLHAVLRLHFAQEDESYLCLQEFSTP